MSPDTALRFLFVVPPFVGHVNPLAAVAGELRAAGHDVAWVGDAQLPARVPDLVAARVFVHDFAVPVRPPRARGFAALKYLWQDVLVPLADAMAPVVERAIGAFGPDVVVADQQAFAGALVAERLGLPWATSATTSSEFTDPLADQPRIAQWQDGLLRDLRSRIGDPAGTADPRFSSELVLLYSDVALTGPLPVSPAALVCVGPALPAPPPAAATRAAAGELPVLVTLGTTNSEGASRFLDLCEAALADLPGPGAVIVDPACTQPVRRGNVSRVGPIDQLAVLARSGAVVCHGGHNTVCEALWFGLPLVVAPIRDDQPIVADQVVRAGAGVRVRFDRIDAAGLADAVREVTANVGYRGAAARVGRSLRAAGGALRAAELLADLAGAASRPATGADPDCVSAAPAARAAPARS